jgi:acyl-CoA dehydrogenase
VEFEYSAKTKGLQERLSAFMTAHVYPNEQRFGEEVDHGDRWQPIPLIEELKARPGPRDSGICFCQRAKTLRD